MSSLNGMDPVVSARGGSQRIARRNIRPFLGLPLLPRTSAVPRATQAFERIVVSTDDAKIAEIAKLAKAADADVSFMPSAHVPADHAGIAPVMALAVRETGGTKARCESARCAHATAVPPVRGDDQRAATIDTIVGDLSKAAPRARIRDREHLRHLCILQRRLDRLLAARQEMFTALQAEGMHLIPTHSDPFCQRTFGTAPRLAPATEAPHGCLITRPLPLRMTDTDTADVITAMDAELGACPLVRS